MSIPNRELSQFASFININDVDKSIAITTGSTPYVGFGITNPTSKLDVIGDGRFSGNVTATTFIGSLSGNASSADFTFYSNVSGISTSVIGGIGSLTSLVVSGNVTATTFIGSLSGNASTADYAKFAGISTNVIGGIGSLTSLIVSGISTFSDGPVIIGSGTSTGTIDQPLQVTGGAYYSGNVGFGTTNPTQKADVRGSIRIDGQIFDRFNNPGDQGDVLTSDPLNGSWYWAEPPSPLVGIISVNDDVTYYPTLRTAGLSSDNGIGFATYFQIDNSYGFVYKINPARLGIGTTNPLAQLHFMNPDMTKDSLILIETDTYNLDVSDPIYQNRGIIGFTENRSVSSSPHQMYAAIFYGDSPEITTPLPAPPLGWNGIGTYGNTNNLVLANSRRSDVSQKTGGVWMAVQDPSTLPVQNIGQTGSFEIYNRAGFSTVTLQAGLSAWGNFGIGTNEPLSKLDVRGVNAQTDISVIITREAYNPAGPSGNAIVFRASPTNNVAGRILISSVNQVNYLTNSDYRLKTNIRPIENSVEKVLALNPSTCNFKSNLDTDVDVFIAHELKEVVPYAAVGEKDEVDKEGNPVHQAVDYGLLTPLLTAALKETIKENQKLKQELELIKTALSQAGLL
jgi:hypothetical protein